MRAAWNRSIVICNKIKIVGKGSPYVLVDLTSFNSQPRALENQLLCVLYTKLARRELNTDIWSQSPLRYHYVTSQCFSDPSDNTIKLIMPPLGYQKKRRKYESREDVRDITEN